MIEVSNTWIWIAVLIVGGVALFFLYKHSSERTRGNLKRFFLKNKYYILIILSWIYFRSKWGIIANSSIANFKSADIFGVWMIMLLLLTNLFIQKQRYISTHAIADNRSGSCSLYQKIGDYVVLNIGSVDATAFPWPFGHETWVVRKESFAKIAKQIITGTQLLQVDLDEVPSQVRGFIATTRGYRKDKIFYGEFSQQAKLSDPTKADVEDKLKDSNRQLNDRGLMIDDQSRQIKKYEYDRSAYSRKFFGRKKEDDY